MARWFGQVCYGKSYQPLTSSSLPIICFISILVDSASSFDSPGSRFAIDEETRSNLVYPEG